MNDKTKSKLAAVMFTDIVGYSSYMSKNEIQALGILEDHNNLLFPLIEKNDGKIIKAIGDALLVDFNSARQSCMCAIEIQKALGERNKTAETSFLLRIGIHLGDIWYTNNDIFGDGVNIAARIEPLASPGGILISRDVFKQVENKIEAKFNSIGRKPLKNIEKPITLYEIVTGYEDKSKIKQDPASSLKNTILEFAGAQMDPTLDNNSNINDGKETTTTPDNPGERLKNKFFNVANKIMDKAIEEWDKQPEEKKKKMIARISEEHIEIPNRRRGRGHNKDGDGLVFGAIATVGFGTALVMTGTVWLLLPMTLLGVMPLISGIRKRSGRKNKKAKMASGIRRDQEKEILNLASSKGGRITALQTAGSTSLTIEEAKNALDSMVKEGYAQLNVEENGTLMYEFSEFLSDKEIKTSPNN